ncbi:hypothetical protein Nepgr_019668 [Nepenthes gracilis]|uniref:Clp R domain-containing protein n=1 Tax=Nepenthes gracilis TaxID=150966 RepID=A0AAD3SVG3_NEPGR|nr:hypothetical protein Nepgr_019668 [Nepenthes gracilis]
MRTGLSIIQQTLTPEAASVLSQSIAEASRRNNGHTTPLHVAATLLASPTGCLRQACIRSQPHFSHPLQCRALELCFSVALERLPTAQNVSPNVEPPISNALMATLKRAQAHQRRGCPEQQQQPLLAVKVELQQLIISILDDPSVSRVMREAGISSMAVKTVIEQSLNSQTISASTNSNPRIGLDSRPAAQPTPVIPSVLGRNLYLNPRLQQQGSAMQLEQQREDEVKTIFEILSRTKKRNPVLVGESEPEALLREVLRRIEKKEVEDGPLKNVEVIISMEELTSPPQQVPAKINELGRSIERRMTRSNHGGIILDLGDLKWLVDRPVSFRAPVSGSAPPHQGVSEAGPAAVAEMGKILMKFGKDSGSNGCQLWLIGTATCETYLRCQVYHPTMQNDWDLQVVSIAARAPLLGTFPRFGSNENLSSSVESLSPLKSFQMEGPNLSRSVPGNLGPRKSACCPQYLQYYEQKLEKLDSEFKSYPTRHQLPPCMQNAEACNNDAVEGTIDPSERYPNFHRKPSLSAVGLCNPILLGRQTSPQTIQMIKNLGEDLQLNIYSERRTSPPGTPVRTDLALGRTKITESTVEKIAKEHIKESRGCVSSESQNKSSEFESEEALAAADMDSFKQLLKGLTEKVWWQKEAASAVATTITQCRSSNAKRRIAGAKGDLWLFFSGPDTIGMKKMARALSEMVCSVGPVTICLSSRQDSEESDSNTRGKTILDRISEAVRRNPFSVIVLQDIDEADALVRASIKRAMERGRLADSHGREISLGNTIFILTANWIPGIFKNSPIGLQLSDEKIPALASVDWQLRLSVGRKTGKRRACWLQDEEDGATKQRKEMGVALSFDLNELADDRLDEYHNSSDITIDHEHVNGRENTQSPATSSRSDEILDSVYDATIIIFNPVDFARIQCDIEKTITRKFSDIIRDKLTLKIESEALEKISRGLWLGETGLEAWMETALVPSINQLKTILPNSVEDALSARLELEGQSESRGHGDWLPSRITVVVDRQ